MKKATFLLGWMIVLIAGMAHAQHVHFADEGVISYEKTVYVKNRVHRYLSSFAESQLFERRRLENTLRQAPETVVLKKTLSFRGNEITFESVNEPQPPPIRSLLGSGLLDYQSTVYQDLGNGLSRSVIDAGGSRIYLEDSLLEVTWKLTNEYRNIAGYECRRANGLTLDSVYVVAFYTDQIPTSAGPGTIHGLPGMILGLVVPEQHYHIYATQVEHTSPTIKSDIAPRRNRPMTRKELIATFSSSMRNQTSEQQRNLLLASMFL